MPDAASVSQFIFRAESPLKMPGCDRHARGPFSAASYFFLHTRHVCSAAVHERAAARRQRGASAVRAEVRARAGETRGSGAGGEKVGVRHGNAAIALALRPVKTKGTAAVDAECS